jgi:hypothetical protein
LAPCPWNVPVLAEGVKTSPNGLLHQLLQQFLISRHHSLTKVMEKYDENRDEY